MCCGGGIKKPVLPLGILWKSEESQLWISCIIIGTVDCRAMIAFLQVLFRRFGHIVENSQ